MQIGKPGTASDSSPRDLSPETPGDPLPTEPAATKNPWREGKYLGFISVALVLLSWFAVTEDGFDLVRPIKFPSPRMVVEGAGVVSHVLPKDIAATLARVFVGWAAGLLVGVGFGLWISFNKKANYFFHPLIEAFRPVPTIALIPFILMWFGINEIGKFLLVSVSVAAFMVVVTVESVRNVPPIFTRAAESLGASRGQIFRMIILPAIVPELIGPLRAAVAGAYTLVVAAEFMGAQAGVGYRILEARRLFNTDVILLGVILFGIMSFTTDTLLRGLAFYITRWSEREARS